MSSRYYKPKVIKPKWIEFSKKKPVQWDLVIVKDERGTEQPGWWTGGVWDFGKKHIKGSVVAWHRRCESSFDRSFDKNQV